MASAQIWTGIAGDGSLINNSNWSATFTPSSTTDITFGLPTPNAAQVITIPGSFSLRDVTFINDSLRPTYTFNGTGSPVVTINGNVAANGAASDVTFASTVGLALTAGSHTIDVGGGAYFRVNGVIADSGGSASIVKNGLSTLVLSGTNTFTGKTTINSGYVSISADSGLGVAPASVVADQLTLSGGALQTTADVTLNSKRGITATGNSSLNPASGTKLTYGGIIAGTTGTLSLQDGGTLILTGANTYSGTFSNSGSILQIGNGGTTGSLDANIANSGSLVFNRSNDITYAGAISGGGTITKQGAGHLYLYGDNTATTTTINAGFVTVGGNYVMGVGAITGSLSGNVVLGGGELQFLRSDAYAFNGNITGTGTVSNYGGVLTLGGAGNTYAGNTFVAASIIPATTSALADNADGAYSPNSTMRVQAGSTLQVNHNETIAGLNEWTTATPTSSGSVAIASGKTLTIANTASNTFSGIVSGNGSLVKSGAGTLTLNGANTYTGKTTINAGALSISAETGLGANPASLVADQLTLNGGTLKTSATLALDDANRGITLGSSGGTLDVASGTTLTVSDVIAGVGALAKTSSGTLVLSATNTYTGGTTLSTGTLRIANAANLGTGALSINGGTLQLANDTATTFGTNTTVGGTATITADRATSSTSSVTHTLGTLSIGAQTLTISRGSNITGTGTGTLVFGATTLTNNATFSVGSNAALSLGAVGDGAGTFGFTKSGSGLLTLTAANTWDGNVTVSNGTLALSGAATLGSGTGGLTISGGTLDLGTLSRSAGAVSITSGSIANGTLTGISYSGQSGTISAGLAGSGAFTKSTSGTVTLSGDNSAYTGNLTASSGTINLSNAAARGTGTWTFNSSSALTLGTAATLSGASTVSTVFNNTAELNAQANGAITGGAQTFNGSSVLNANVSNSITGGQQTFSSTASTPAELDANHVNAISGGTQTFNGTTSLQVTASGVLGEGTITGAITGGHQIFNDTAFLKAHTETQYVISGGTQDFYSGAALVASGPNMITGGAQNFHGAVGDNASIPVFPSGVTTTAQFVALDLNSTGQTTISNFLKTTPRLTINGSGTVTDGTQTFTGNASLQANIGSGLQGGTQYFSDFSHLRASKQDSVIGGSQSFSGNAFLWASAGYAVTGGSQHFTGSSGAYATATHSISGVTLNLAGNSFISIGADNALDTSTEIYFSGSAGGTGGTLSLNGHPVAVGEIRSGATTVNPGIIQNGSSTAATLTVGVDSESTLDLADETPNFSGQIKNGLVGSEVPAAALAFTKNGSGTLVLSGTNTYTGATSINAGTLEITQPSALPSATAVVFNGDGGVLALDSASTPSSEILNYAVGSIAGTDSGSVIALPASTSLTTSANTDTTFAGAILGTTSSSLIKGGTGALTLTGVNYYGQTVIDAGSVVIGTTNALRTGSSESSSLGHDVTINSSGALVVSNDQTIRALSGTGAVQLGTGKTLTVNLPDGGAGSTSTFSGTFSGNTGTLKKDGPGTLILAGASSHFFGGTTLSSGILQLANTNALAGSTVTYTGGTLDFGSLTSVVLGGLAGSRDLALTAPLNVGGNEQNTTYSGTFTGSQSLTKDGDGTLTLTGSSSSYTGAVIVNNGTLALGNGGTTGGFSSTSSVTVNLGATLINNRSDDISYSGVLSGAGTIKKQGSGIFEITSNNPSFTGMAQISQGGLRLIGAGGFGGAAVNVLSTGQLSGNGTVGVLSVSNGGSIAPASATSSIGTLHAGATTFGADGHYFVDITDVMGGAGTGWDLMTVSALSITATSAHPFAIELHSFSSESSLATNFNSSLTYSFAIVNATSITGFDPSVFSLVTSGFQNSLNGGSFSLSTATSGGTTQLLVNFTPVPEPSTWALLISGLGVLALGARRRLRRR